MSGKLLVLEGTDASGKSTQFERLCQALDARGIAYRRLVFPRYKEESSALIRMYLGGHIRTMSARTRHRRSLLWTDMHPIRQSGKTIMKTAVSFWRIAIQLLTPCIRPRSWKVTNKRLFSTGCSTLNTASWAFRHRIMCSFWICPQRLLKICWSTGREKHRTFTKKISAT